MASSKFPNASIWVPEINFSQALPESEQETLRQLNEYIKTKNYIPAIPAKQFRVGQDHIHWTENTALNMVKAWMQSLN